MKKLIICLVFSVFLIGGVSCFWEKDEDDDNSAQARVVNYTSCTLSNVRYGTTNWGTITAYGSAGYRAISGSQRIEFTANATACQSAYLAAPGEKEKYLAEIRWTSGTSCAGCNFTVWTYEE